MPNNKSNNNMNCSIWMDYDLVVLADHEAGKLDLSRAQFFKRAVIEYIARLHASSVCQSLSQRIKEKAK